MLALSAERLDFGEFTQPELLMDDRHPLQRLAAEFARPADAYLDPSLYARLSIVEQGGGLHVDFHGSPLESSYFDLCSVLRSPGIAESLASVVLRSPDVGDNGTCNWDLDGLLDTPATFDKLKLFSIEQCAPGDHNRKVVAARDGENGALARLLLKAPALDALVSPSAPDATFFEHPGHPLRYLNIDAGFATQNFIGNLTDSKAFPGMKRFEFGEFNETYMKDFSAHCTPLEDYRRLFVSPAFEKVSGFTWRNPVCSAADITALRALLPHRFDLKIVRFSSEHVRAA